MDPSSSQCRAHGRQPNRDPRIPITARRKGQHLRSVNGALVKTGFLRGEKCEPASIFPLKHSLWVLSLMGEKVSRRRPRLLVTLRSGQGARALSLRLGQNTDLLRKSWFFALAPLQAPSLSASPRFLITLRLFATRGFTPTQAKPGPAPRALGFCFRCAPSALLTTA